MRTKIWIPVVVLLSLVVACNLPFSQAAVTQTPDVKPAASAVDAVATSVELTMGAKLTQTASSIVQSTATVQPSATHTSTPTLAFTPTLCTPQVTANVNSNVRSGPNTAYDVVGSLLLGQSATIVGANDAYTWWYIDYPAASGGHGWIAGSVVTSSCVPPVVQVVAAPPLPTSPPATNVPPTSVSGAPDLIVSEFAISPATPIMGQNAHVRIGAYNQGNAASGAFTVLWYGLSSFSSPSCSWTVDHMNARGGRILECDFVFSSWYPINKTSLAVVDANNQVSESNEGNNQGVITPFGVADD